MELSLTMTNNFSSGCEDGSKYIQQDTKPSAGDVAKSLKEWWDSDACKQLQKEQEESLQRAVGKYHMLSESDKIDMVQAICYIMRKAEEEGTSHRGLMDSLGIYPSGFWITELMDVHNALYSFFWDKKNIK